VLELPPEEMRRLGHRVVDRIVDHIESLDALPPVRVGDAAALRAALGGPPPEAPSDPDAALDALFEQVLPFIQHGDHPRFFARIGSPSNYVSVLADAAAAGLNVFAGSWTGGSGPATVELVVLDWLRELCGMPDGTDGVLVSGGSVASLVALAAARTAVLGDRAPEEAVAYLGAEGHASVARALRVLGLTGEQIRVLRNLARPTRARRSRPTWPPAGGRSASRRPPARPAPARSTRSPSSRTCAPSTGSGSTSTAPTALLPC
jgi:aromatic-L-amino-acid decarboxylase